MLTFIVRCLALIFCFASQLQAAEPVKPVITIYVTVDWEGWSLDNDNIEAMRDFRQKYPNIPMLHLLNPAYYTRADNNSATITKQIQSTLLPSDAQGLHIHAWKSLVNFCQIPYQHAPSFADIDENCTQGDCGYTVSLEYAYKQEDLTKLVACSIDILQQQGFARPVHFRAGGWQLGTKLSNALQQNGFIWDSSRIDANLLTTSWHVESGMIKMVSALHQGSTTLDQPYTLLAANEQHAALMEYPNNAALADYTSTKQILTLFKRLIAEQKAVMVLGFHQETATSYLPRLEDAIPLMEEAAKDAGLTIEWATYPYFYQKNFIK